MLHRNTENKKEVLKQFCTHNSIILVCTSLLSAEFNYKSIRVVTHFQAVYSLVDFAQESERASRDNEFSKLIVFTSSAYETVSVSSKRLEDKIQRVMNI